MKTRILLSIVLVFSFWNSAIAQIGIGNSSPEAALDVTSSTNGVLVPRIALTANNSVSPVVNPNGGAVVVGTLIWNTATVAGVNGVTPGFYYWNGTLWTALGGSSSGIKWDLAGNVVGAPGTSFLGSTDNNPVRFRSNNLDRFEINQDGSLRSFGDGTAALPAYSWDTNSNMGIFKHPTATLPNSMGIATNGNERLRFIGTPQIQGVSAQTWVGTNLVPFYSFYNNTNTGMYSPAAGKLAFATNAIERLRIENNGYLGLNGAGATPQAALDIVSTNKGILIPRVALTSLIASAPVILIQNSELVYNTATAGTAPNDVTPGFYYWTTAPAKWNKVGGSVDVKSGPASATATLVEPNAGIPGPVGAMITAGNDTTGQTFESPVTITRTFNVTGLIGNTAYVQFTLKFQQDWMPDVYAYLTSPTGQIIELTTGNGPLGPTGTIRNFNVTFTDTAASNITTYNTGDAIGTYKPEGSLTVSALAPNIQYMSGFNGFSPNGTWTLTIKDNVGGNPTIYQSSILEIATYNPLLYRLVGETSMAYKSATNLVVNSTYSANPIDDAGVITAITRSTASAGAVGTTIAAIPGTVLSYASDSPKQGVGNYWVSTNNQSVSNGLTNGTTYYFQLWAKANVQAPLTDNEIFSIIPMMVPQ